MKRSYSGPAAGVGAIYAWSGNDAVGTGKQTITTSEPPRLVRIHLEFIEPWPQTAPTTFTFTPAGEGTAVTWAIDGTNDFAGKAFSLFMDMDALLGKDFDRGLARLKGVAEAEATQARQAAAQAAKRAAEAEALRKAAEASSADLAPAPVAQPQPTAAPGTPAR